MVPPAKPDLRPLISCGPAPTVMHVAILGFGWCSTDVLKFALGL
jgi:hypothetical protein